ncbi:hypothetical protein HI914_04144 [Erysiphe necator]|nr:hypothetical protein HI914_04144 [Erysiphe necator]
MTHLRVEEQEDGDLISLELDNEINALQSQLSNLKSQRFHRASTVLSAETTLSQLSFIRKQKETPDATVNIESLLSTAKAQYSHNQTNLYRICATITPFRIQDPDPNAVNNGHILGLRFDVSNNGKFIRPYYIMLNKLWNGEKNMLSVHRHTLPPAIPLSTLVEKYLVNHRGPLALASGSKVRTGKQSLLIFSRALRRSIVAYHNRLSLIKNFRIDFGLDVDDDSAMIYDEEIILDLSALDSEMKNLRLEWIDGRVGRIVINEDGEIKKCIIISEGKRHRASERALSGSLQNLGEKLWEEHCRRRRSTLNSDDLN